MFNIRTRKIGENLPLDYEGYLEISLMSSTTVIDANGDRQNKRESLGLHGCNDDDIKHFSMNDEIAGDFLN